MERSIIYVGLDVHKDTIAVALAEAGLRAEVREHGKIANTPAALKALSVKLAGKNRALRFCYEAGPCGYGIQRHLSAIGHECAVVAPSLIPRKPGDRIKTDRRDAINLAKLHRAGELTRSGYPTRRMRRSAISSVRVRRQSAVFVRPVSNCPASCCVTASTITARRGRCCIGAGWPA
jgi:transposase